MWYPGIKQELDWIEDQTYLNYFKNSPDKQAIAIRETIREQTSVMSLESRKIVASNEQITCALEEGFGTIEKELGNLAGITEYGFEKITNAIECMQGMMEYNFSILTQQAELQSEFLSDIVAILEMPFETQVREFYKKGCLFVQQGKLFKAEKNFNKCISMDDSFFPAYYQLGRLYLFGKEEEDNLINPEKAMDVLILANDCGQGIVRTDKEFKPVLAYCQFLLSLSYYRQLKGSINPTNRKLLNKAIEFCEKAIELKPNLSNAHYHLAKYYAYQNKVEQFLSHLKMAVELNRNYSVIVFRDKVFQKQYHTQINDLINQMRVKKMEITQPKLEIALAFAKELELQKITQSISYANEFMALNDVVQLAKKNFDTQTYFGIDDSQSKIDTVSIEKFKTLIKKRNIELRTEIETERLATEKHKWEEEGRASRRRSEIIDSTIYGAVFGMLLTLIFAIYRHMTYGDQIFGNAYYNNILITLAIIGAIIGLIIGIRT